VPASGDRLGLDLDPYQIATIRARPSWPATAASPGGPAAELAPRVEAAQPVFADYWLHNKGPAPMGYRPVAVHIRPDRANGPGPFALPISVASSRTDLPVAGTVSLALPPGWVADLPERPFRLAPGAHLSFDTSITPVAGAAEGRYFVAARIEDEAGQVHEDVVTIDLVPDATASTTSAEGSAALASALRRTRRREAEIFGEAGSDPGKAVQGPAVELGDELEVRLLTPVVRVAPGEPGELRVRLRNTVADEIRGEAQLISPYDTWPITSPWTTGFAIGAGDEATLAYAVAPPSGFRPGRWWGLVKVMYFGRLHYSEAAVIEVLPGPH
jgi:hypothetical protein